MPNGRSAAELGAFGVTPGMPMDAVLELLREFRQVRRKEGVPDPIGAYIADIAFSQHEDSGPAEVATAPSSFAMKGALSLLGVEKRLATTRGGRTPAIPHPHSP